MVSGEQSQQVAYAVVEVSLEHLAGQLHTCLEIGDLLQVNQFFDLLQNDWNLERPVLLHLCHPLVMVFEESNRISRPISKNPIELIPPPLNTVLNLTGEVPHSTHGDRLLGWVLNIVVC